LLGVIAVAPNREPALSAVTTGGVEPDYDSDLAHAL
jgi:hypothetical protein